MNTELLYVVWYSKFRVWRKIWSAPVCSKLRSRLSRSSFTGDNQPKCLEDTRKQTLQRIDKWVNIKGYLNVFILIGAAGIKKLRSHRRSQGSTKRSGPAWFPRVFPPRGEWIRKCITDHYVFSCYVRASIAESLVEKLRKKRRYGFVGYKNKI